MRFTKVMVCIRKKTTNRCFLIGANAQRNRITPINRGTIKWRLNFVGIEINFSNDLKVATLRSLEKLISIPTKLSRHLMVPRLIGVIRFLWALAPIKKHLLVVFLRMHTMTLVNLMEPFMSFCILLKLKLIKMWCYIQNLELKGNLASMPTTTMV